MGLVIDWNVCKCGKSSSYKYLNLFLLCHCCASLNSLTFFRYFEIFILLTILINCVFLALTDPPEEPEWVSICYKVSFTTDIINTQHWSFFTFELSILFVLNVITEFESEISIDERWDRWSEFVYTCFLQICICSNLYCWNDPQNNR